MSAIPAIAALFLGLRPDAHQSQVRAYEAFQFPEQDGWTRISGCTPERALVAGWLVETVEVECGGPPGGDQDAYQLASSNFVGLSSFFVEWRVRTDGARSEIIGVAPASMAFGDWFGVNYHFTIASDQVRFLRDNRLPSVFLDLDPTVPHTYRVELIGADSYTWYLDGVLSDTGAPEGQLDLASGLISFLSRPWYLNSSSWWDFVRLGRIPDDASGDYDSDLVLTLLDHYFVIDCLTKDGPGIFGGPDQNAGPGCAFTDFDFDLDVDLFDFAEFANHYTGFLP